ncbi:MAG TPA: Ig-like domain-containing protein, partial [Planctomycetaceae bacterium]
MKFRDHLPISLLSIALLSISLAIPPLAHAAEPPELTILPPQPVLSGPHAVQQLVVEQMRGGQFLGDVTGKVKFASLNPEVALVSLAGIVTPVADGTAMIRAEIDGRLVETPVAVKSANAAEQWSFRHDVQAVLTKSGCNMGACHGAQAGKKGFKLALRGYDSPMDYNTLTRQSKGRRVSLADPAHSLILLKATGTIPHGGGARFDDDSLEYRIVSEWIAEGAP